MGIKWMIKKSDFYEVRKSVNKEADSKTLEQLKKEVIAILEKKDSQEYKKAIEHFEKDESKYSRLEKSVTGEWIEKAGYGVGTVRIWKGKKYKKVSASPVRWVRVFDKNDRGAATSMGKYIAQVKKCSSVEELYQFCMKQRSLFQDENGNDLPIMDKLRSAIDEQSGKLESGDKVNSRMKEYQKEDLEKLKAGNYSFDSFADFKAEIKKQGNDFRGSKQPNYIGYLSQYNDNYLQQVYDSLPKKDSKVLSNGKTVKEVREQYGIKTEKKDELSKYDKDVKQNIDQYIMNFGGDKEKVKTRLASNYVGNPEVFQRAVDDADFRKYYNLMNGTNLSKDDCEKKLEESKQKLQSFKKIMNLSDEEISKYKKEAFSDYSGYESYKEKKNAKGNDKKEKINSLATNFANQLELSSKEERKKALEDVIKRKGAKSTAGLAAKMLLESDFTKEKEDNHYWIMDSKRNRLTNESAKKRIKASYDEIDKIKAMLDLMDKADQVGAKRDIQDLEYDIKNLMDKLNSDDRKEMESEAEKHQNRSDAMKGNQNAKKYGASMDDKEPIAKTTKVADGKVTIPNDPAVKSQMKQLIASRYTDYVGNTHYGDILSEVYYDGENLVSTDAKAMKVIKIGKLDGIEPNKYVKIDISGKDNISINQMDKKVGQYPSYKRVIPDGNDQTFAIDNKLAKEKIEAMKRDGSIPKNGYVALEFDGDAIKVDGTIVGKTYGTKFDTDHLPIQADYILNVLGKNGEETNFNASDSSRKAITVTTNVSTDVIMPMVNGGIPDYEQNRKDFKERQEFESERKAEAEKVKAEQDSRRIKAETKKDLIGNRPEGIDADEYSSMIDFADDYYVKLGYDNSGERSYGMIKRMVDNAINQVNSKDYDFEEVLLNSDNKVSRKIFEMLTGERVGSNKQTAKKAWENWVGQEAVDAHNKKIADAEKAEKDKQAAEQKAKDDAEREQYHGFMDGKTPAGKGKAKDVLGKRANFNGTVMSWQELADKYIAEGGHARASTYVTNGGKEKPYYSISNKDGLGYEVPKTVYDYAMHISNGVKKSIADIIMLDEYEHEDFDDDFEDFDASQSDLFNSPAYKVSAALDSVFGNR